MNRVTYEQVEKELEARGLRPIEDLDADEIYKAVEDHFDFKMAPEFAGADIYFYEESTADGYSIYIATSDPNMLCMQEDVYYYDTDRFEKLRDSIVDGNTIYIDSYDMGDWRILEIFEELYQEIYSEAFSNLEQDLNEEIE